MKRPEYLKAIGRALRKAFSRPAPDTPAPACRETLSAKIERMERSADQLSRELTVEAAFKRLSERM